MAAPAKDTAPSDAALAPEINALVPLRRRQLAEFNQWLYRWNDYQQCLNSYWKERYHELSSHHKSAEAADDVETKDQGKQTGKVEENWILRYQELLDFKEEHGNTNVPRDFVFKHSSALGKWVARMRYQHKINKLEESRVKRLEQIGFQFVVKNHEMIPFSATWDKNYRALAEFRDTHGHCEVPDDRAGLCLWISRQRSHFRKGKLPDHLKVKLQALEINLGGKGRPFGLESEESWSAKLRALAEYRDTHHDCNVTKKYEKDPELGSWLQAQRDAYGKGILSESRIQSLSQLGFDFLRGRKRLAAAIADPWQRHLSELRAFQKREGHTNVPRKFDLNLSLGIFVHDQKMAHKDGTLSEDKRKALEEIGFDWTFKRARKASQKKTNTVWDSRFSKLVKYKSEHGTLDVPDTPEENQLVKWIKRQRLNQREGRMNSDKYESLKALGFCFAQPKQERKSWMEHYESLVEFHKESGHFRVPTHYKPNPQLHTWIMTQKHKHKIGKLPEDRLALLNEIEFDFTPKVRGGADEMLAKDGHFDFAVRERRGPKVAQETYTEDLWETAFLELAAYKTSFGHCHVPITYDVNPSLGAWAFSQQMAYKRNKLPEDRVEKLNELGFSFGPKKDIEVEV